LNFLNISTIENQPFMISKALISALTDHLPQAVIVFDQKEEVVYCNDSAAQFWQRDSQRLLGKQSRKLFHADVMIQEKIRGVLNSGNVFRMGGYVLKTPPLQERGAEIVIAPVRNKTGKVKQAVITLLESTTLQETQAREQEEQLSRALGTLAASLAHEIQNPLSGVRGMLQLLERDLQKSKISNSSTGMMLAELDRVERLLKQLLLHSHPLPLELTSFDVHELLNTVIRFEQNTATQIRFIRSFDTSLPDIQADRDKMHQVFLNLIRNAAEASKADASVTVHTRYCGKWELAGTNLDPERSYTLIAVEDEGSGVSNEQREQLFKPLFSTKKEGHGLGLSISHRLIQAHGGLLRYVQSNSGGSIFQVFLPHHTLDLPV
jgi:two-component system nitrogen regulation sensor histidine kinase GlnL